MSKIFKISYIDNNEIEKIYVFLGETNISDGSDEEVDLVDLFEREPSHSVFKDIFNSSELSIILEKKIEIKFCKEQIHIDDTIETIKNKLIKEFSQHIAFEEIYLFAKKEEVLNAVAVYQNLTQNDKLDLTRDRLIQFLLNIDEINIDSIPVKDIYNYDDILSLNINQKRFLVKKPIGQRFVALETTYPYTVSPYDTLLYDTFLSQYAQEITTVSNQNLLMNSGDLKHNMIYLCLVKDVLKYAKKNSLSEETTIKIYFPYLFKSGIISNEKLTEKHETLYLNTKKRIDKYFNKKNVNIDLLYNIYKERKTDLNYKSKGIKTINFTLHPEFTFNLPLDIVFKLIHSTKDLPLIKYNPGKRQENIYRLYCNQIATNGKKIPYLNKGSIFKLIKTMGKNKSVSVYVEKIIGETTSLIFCEFEENGDVSINAEFAEVLTLEDVEKIIKENINPIIQIVKNFLEQSGYYISLFKDFNNDNIEIIDMTYESTVSIERNMNLKRIIGCISSCFSVIENDLNKGIFMRFKRVANYNEMESEEAFIIELINKKLSSNAVINELKENFGLTEENAKIKYASFLDSIQLQTNLYQNKKFKIKANPGFLTKINKEQIPLSKNIIINVSGINDINYLDTLNIYLDTVIRLTQDTSSTNVPEEKINEICKGKNQKDGKHIPDIIAPSEKPYTDNKTLNIVDQQLVFEAVDENTEEGEDLLDILMGEDIPDDEQDEGSQDGGALSEDDDDEEEENVEEIVSSIKKIKKVIPKPKAVNLDEPEERLTDFTGTRLTYPNPIVSRLEARDPKLFLTRAEGPFKAYSRSCPSDVRRQPIILTDEEKRAIDENHQGSYTEAIKYGSSPSNQYWYICPRYWSLKDNVSLTEEEAKSGKYGAIISADAKKVPPGGNVIEFNHQKEHIDKNGNYIPHYPGFMKVGSHPDGLCVPCCFKNWDTSGQKERRDQCLRQTEDTKPIVPKAKKQILAESYIIGPEKFPLEHGKWGYLPLAVQKFLRTDNTKCYKSSSDTTLRPNHPCLLRLGVQLNEKQSFIACIANAFSELLENNLILSINDMKKTIINNINLDLFITLQNGNLIQIFDNDKIDVLIKNYKTTKLYKSINLSDKIQVDFLKRVIKSYETFIDYLKDDNVVIDHKYLWDIITRPHPNLFVDGLNLIILELPRNDITDNINLLCPTNNYSNNIFDVNKPCLILLKIENYYEPIYLLEDKETSWNIQRVFRLKNSNLLPNLRNTLDLIRNSYIGKCRPLPSIPTIYKFKTNIVLSELKQLLEKLDYNINEQIMNFNGKIIGAIVKNSKDDKCFVPCYPSSPEEDIRIKLMDDEGIWNGFRETVDFLMELSKKSKKKIPCLPKIKVLESGLIIGLLTETNQFIATNEPEENTSMVEMEELESDEVNMKEISGLNFISPDIISTTSNNVDTKRVKTIKKIKLESNFYNVFRNTIRVMLGQFKNRKIRESIEEIIKNPYLLYSNKLRQISDKLKRLTQNYITFSEYSSDIIEQLSEITNCMIEDKCEEKNYCMRKSDGICNLIISKTNLINNQDNEITYFIKMSDELIRYNRIKHFIFEPKSFLSFSNIKYNLRDDEIILLQSLLTQDYFDDLIPSIQNQYVKHNTYDTAIPIESQNYDNEVYRMAKKTDIKDIADEIKCNIKENTIITGKLKKMFPKDTIEIIFGNNPPLCTFEIMVTVINDNDKRINMTKQQLKDELISEYEKYDEYLLEITNILKKQGKKFSEQIKEGQIMIQDMIMSEAYYITNLDIWLLAKRFNIPLILLSGTELKENNKTLLVANIVDGDKYYFIKTPGINPLKIPKYRLIISNKIAKIPINSLSLKTQDMIRSQETEANVDDYIKTFVNKMERKPRKKIERIKIVQDKIKPKKKKNEKLKLILEDNNESGIEELEELEELTDN
jgi:hypothetical protein